MNSRAHSMRRTVAWAVPTAVVSLAALAALALDHRVSVISKAQAQDLKAADSDESHALCPRGNATLRGTYLSMGGGSIGGVGAVAFVGKGIFDGKGNITNPFTISVAGAISEQVAQGTYTLNSDCTGTQTLAGANHFNFIITPDGSKFDYIETDAGTVISGSASRMKD